MPAKPFFILLSLIFFIAPAQAQSEPFTKRVVASGFNSAWEITYGPGDSLWATESRAYRVQRVSVATGQKTLMLDLRADDASINFDESASNWPQGGLMGMALHPNLYSSDPAVRAAKPWVYIAYVYNKGICNSPNGCFYTTKIVRYNYEGNTLTNPVTLVSNIPGSSDHNSGRLVIGPEIETAGGGLNDQYRLYYTVGDMGAGQFANANRTQNAQNQNSYEGKVLRLNTEIDGDAGADAWVPDNNPYYNSSSITPQDYVYTRGHRNAQGLVWGSVGGVNRLYSSEQMDRTDDEINIIEEGRNYGWDRVAGYCDGNVNGYYIGTTSNANENTFCSATPTHKEPIFTMFTVSAANMAALYAESDNSKWPTIACSSIDFYGFSKIANWQNSLFITALKRNRVYRIRLNTDGTAVAGDTIPYFRNDGDRIRDMAISKDGLKFYVARDVGATVNGGTIMEYTYTGVTLALHEDEPTNNPRKDLVQIFPNPTADVLTIHGKKEFQKPLLVQLFDSNGRLLQTTRSFHNDLTLNMNSYASGIYLLKLYDGNGKEVTGEKIIRR